MKRIFRRMTALLVAGILLFSFPASALTRAQCDLNNDGNIDVLDLVRAKKLEVGDPQTYNADFFAELKRILLGNSEPEADTSSQENTGSSSSGNTSSGGSAIYLPEIPC